MAGKGTELPSAYDPKQTEEKWYDYWMKGGFFQAGKDPSKPPFTIVIPPPNVTGNLHIGHALNNTLQDILIRWNKVTLTLSTHDAGGITQKDFDLAAKCDSFAPTPEPVAAAPAGAGAGGKRVKKS